MRLYGLVVGVLWLSCSSLLCNAVGGNPLKCRVGWEGQERTIPPDKINDDYCDCPFDGLDEPNTDACAGSVGWTGISGKTQASLPVYQCPQQPKLQLSLSRMNDGICDCCDGSDENSGVCPDICDQILAEERAAQARAEQNFALGYQIRQELLAEFESLRQTTLKEINVKQDELKKVEADQNQVQSEMAAAKQEYMNKRLKVVETVRESVRDIFRPLTQGQLVSFIVQACQLAGEMKGAADGSTCVPLRLAGMDMGFVWEDEDIGAGKGNFKTLMEDSNSWEPIAELMDKHVRGQWLDWSQKKQEPAKAPALQTRKSSRRDEREHDDDDDEYSHDYEDEYGDDVYYGEDDADSKNDKGGNTNDEVLKEVRSLPLSRFRLRFLQNADSLIHMIEDMTNEADDDEEGDHEDEETKEQVEISDRDATIDPAALQMNKNTLQRRREHIEKGFKYAASAFVLTRAVVDQGFVEPKELEGWLMDLAIGTVLHGNVGSQDVWQLLVISVPDFGYNVAEIEESCAPSDDSDVGACVAAESAAFDDHLAGLCPPRIIELLGKSFPPQPIVDAAHELCDGLIAEPPKLACTSTTEPPKDIPDGFCGYFDIHPRSKEDFFHDKLAPLHGLGASPEISELNEKVRNVDDTLRDGKKELEELYERIGGRNQDKFGANGELYSLSKDCPFVEAGKYIYEVCLFGKASQKDRDEEHSRGTDLGKWENMSIDEETGERVMTWSGGAKCWNGPQRSATVHVTCGVTTRVLSAEEPDTCRYVLEMETPIACDEEYKKRFGL